MRFFGVFAFIGLLCFLFLAVKAKAGTEVMTVNAELRVQYTVENYKACDDKDYPIRNQRTKKGRPSQHMRSLQCFGGRCDLVLGDFSESEPNKNIEYYEIVDGGCAAKVLDESSANKTYVSRIHISPNPFPIVNDELKAPENTQNGFINEREYSPEYVELHVIYTEKPASDRIQLNDGKILEVKFD